MMDLVKSNGRAALHIAMHNIAADIDNRSVTAATTMAPVKKPRLNQSQCRAALCRKLAWLGVKLDDQPNASGARAFLSGLVIPTNEELMIAQHTPALVRP